MENELNQLIDHLTGILPATATNTDSFRRDFGYLISYPQLLKSFTLLLYNLNDTPEHVYALCCMAYGWMPTTVKFGKTGATRAQASECAITISNILTTLRNASSVSATAEISRNVHVLREFLGCNKLSPLPGPTMILHFCNPAVFAICDSNIGKLLSMPDHQNAVPAYLKFMEEFKTIFQESGNYSRKRDEIKRALSYEVTDIRLIEMAFFYMAKDTFYRYAHPNLESELRRHYNRILNKTNQA